MQNSFQPSAEFQQLVKAQLKGNWKSVLEQHLGAEVLAKPNQPCPFCGGSDRFSFTDKFVKRLPLKTYGIEVPQLKKIRPRIDIFLQED